MEKITVTEFLKIPKEEFKGKIIVFPTDTVYGVGCLYGDSNGVQKIYQMKKRDYGKPLPVLCSSIEMVQTIAIVDDRVMEYAKKWPAALTIILSQKTSDGTIAIRIPDSEIALSIINHLGPLSTTSVNYSGEKELNDCEEIGSIFSSCIDYLVCDQVTLSSLPSTIISCVDKEIKIIRQGSIIF